MNSTFKLILPIILLFILLPRWVLAEESVNLEVPYNTHQPYYKQNLYFAIGGGYAMTDWAGLASNGVGIYTSATANGRGGGIFDVLMGYQYIKFLSFEFGYTYLPLVSGNSTAGFVKSKHWMINVAAKIFVPIYHQFYVFGKLGVGYEQVHYTGIGATVSFNNARIWTPIYGAGLQYFLPRGFYLSAMWIRIPEYVNTGVLARQLPSSDLFLGNVGIRFLF